MQIYFSSIKLVSLRKLAQSRNVFVPGFFNQNDMDFVTEISFCKTPVVDEKGWVLEVESQIGK